MYIPSQAKKALKDLAAQIKLARKRRRLTIAELAEKINVTPPTIIAVEKGAVTVGVGILFSILWTLGLEKELKQITNPVDSEGFKLQDSRLPQKVKKNKKGLSNDF